jgi:CheY-like chemotaxis protein
MNMPQINGEELGKIIKSDPQISQIVLLMLTSVNLRGDIQRLKQIGFSGYLTKPIRQIHLLQMLANVFSPGTTSNTKSHNESYFTEHRTNTKTS